MGFLNFGNTFILDDDPCRSIIICEIMINLNLNND